MCRTQERRNAFKIFVGHLKGRVHLGDKCTWEDNIKMDLREKVCDYISWNEPAPYGVSATVDI
jgi:hypothetical protein